MLEVQAIGKWFPAPGRPGRAGWPRRAGQEAAAADAGQSSNRSSDASSERQARQQGRQFFAVRDVSFQAHSGSIVGLLGPNGAGKTTLLRMLSTAIQPSAGTARFDGVDIVAAPLEVRRKIGFLSGTTGIYGRLTAREMVAYHGALHGVPAGVLAQRMDELFALLDMASYADRRNDRLSTGMRQKVSIARTLIHDPAIVIFDEPTTGLDVAAAETVTRIIARCREQGKTVLFSTHHMHEVDLLCDHVVILREGRLCFDSSVAAMRERAGEDKLDRAFLALIAPAERGGA